MRLGGKMLVIAGLVVVALPGILPALDHRFFQSHDGFEHVFRTLAVMTGMRQGALVPRWTQELAGGFGYPLFAVYSPLAYLPPALLTFAGLDILSSVKIDLAALCLTSAVGAYLALRQIAGRPASFVAAACYACAPYTLANAYVRLDLAELSTFPLTALITAGFLHLMRLLERDTRPTFVDVGPAIALTAVPLGALPATHSLSIFTYLPALLAVLMLVIVRGRRHLRMTLVILGGVCSLSAALAAWYLAPLVQWQGWIRLSTLHDDSHFRDKLLNIPALMRGAETTASWNWFGPSTNVWTYSVAPGPFGELPSFPAYPVLVAACCAVALAIWRQPRRAVVIAFGGALLVSCWLDTSWSLWLWSSIPRLTQLQFPWRVLGTMGLLAALLAGLFVEALPHRASIPAAFILCGMAVAPAALLVRPDYREIDPAAITWPTQARRELQGGFGTTGSGLFLPTWVATTVPGTLTPVSESVSASPILIDSVSFDGTHVEFSYRSPVDAPLVLARLYAPPWTATLDGKLLALVPQPVTGFQQIEIPAGHGHVAIRLDRTFSANAGNTLSLIGAGICAVLLGLPLVRHDRFYQKSDVSARRMRLYALAYAGIGAACIAVLFTAIHVPLILRRQTTWSQPSEQSIGAPITIEAWSIEPTGTWDRRPVLSVAMFARSGVTVDEDVVVALFDGQGKTIAERSQRPRIGTFSTQGWPAGLLVEDHLLLPGPAEACGATYQVAVGFRPHTQQEPVRGQILGKVTVSGPLLDHCLSLPVKGDEATSTPRILVNGIERASLTPIVPGEVLNVSALLNPGGPTRNDNAIVVELVGPRGAPVTSAQSYGNLDLIFTSLWRRGAAVPLHASLTVPADAPIGLYRLRASLYDPSQDLREPVLLTPASQAVAGTQDLALFKIPSVTSGPATTLATFGGIFDLVDSDITGGAANSISPGDTLHLTEDWRLAAVSHLDYTLFVQVLDPAGKLVAQSDGMPLDGGYPTTAWSVGEFVRETRDLSLPKGLAPGRYSVISGWYTLTTGQRLPVEPAQPGNAWVLGYIAVTTR